MNCRRFAVGLLALVILVHAGRAVKAKGPTSRPATATATILTAANNDVAKSRLAPRAGTQGQNIIRKFVDSGGHVHSGRQDRSIEIVIIDLP